MNQEDLFINANPTLLTANESLDFFAEYGNSQAKEFAKLLGYEPQKKQDTENSLYLLKKAINIYKEIRYISSLALFAKLSDHIFLDLPCGLTPRFLWMAKNKKDYIGADLPIVINKLSGLYNKLLSYEEKQTVYLKNIDITSNQTITDAITDIDKPLLISTEGLLMYLTEAELCTAMENIRSILVKKNGYWISMDRTMKSMTFDILKILCNDNLEELISLLNTQKTSTQVRTTDENFNLYQNSLYIKDIKTVNNFLTNNGFSHNQIPLSNLITHLITISDLEETKKTKILDLCANYFIDIFTTDSAYNKANTYSSSSDFNMQLTFSFNQLYIKLRGRLDSISSPNLLDEYMRIKNNKQEIETIVINMLELDYISSAGLRVLLIMMKDLKDTRKLRIINYNDVIFNIFKMTGFDEVFGI